MFHEGDLQSGITQALAESKLVACFVRDDSVQSISWENEFLKDDQIAAALSMRTVLLRITANSREAGYLSAYYPVPTVPALLVLHNGRVLLCLGAGLEKSQFRRSVLQTLDGLLSLSETTESFTGQRTLDSVSSTASTVFEPENETSTSMDVSTVRVPQPTSTTQTSLSIPHDSESSQATPFATPAVAPPVSSTAQDMFAERRQRLERDKQEKEAAENAERTAKAEARRKTISAAPDSAKAKQANYAQQQRKRNQEARLERERILKEIESNKAERKEKEELRKAFAKAEAEGNDGAGGLIDQQLAREVSSTHSEKTTECALQVRLFDGSTVRRRLLADESLRIVRQWIDQRPNGDTPYTFKHILTPMPNRTFSISEEDESLRSLGLMPSATLVIVPVQRYSAAYPGDRNLFLRAIFALYHLVRSGAITVISVLSAFLGIGQAGAREPQVEQTSAVGRGSSAQHGTADKTPQINVRTLRDQLEDREDYQLYNGNQLNFEPRRDPEDNEE